MNRIALISSILLAGCFEEPLLGDVHEPAVSVCVKGAAGSCCTVFWDICVSADPECVPGDPLPRTPMRCLLCWPHDIDDGGPGDRGMPGMPAARTQPRNPPPDSAVYTAADGGLHDPRLHVCGPATYTDH